MLAELWTYVRVAYICRHEQGRSGGLWQSMVRPFTIGPMGLKGFTWYQGESNIGSAKKPGANSYRMHIQELVSGWRSAFDMTPQSGWFGFVQIAGCRYAVRKLPL
jgi:hypothetical protein